MPRWTTERAVSGGADFRSRKVSPTFSPVKERMGRVASSEMIERGFGVGDLRELGVLKDRNGLRVWRWEEVKKTEEEKKEREDGTVVVAVVAIGEAGGVLELSGFCE